MFKRKGGGGKGLLNNVKKNCTFLSCRLPLPRNLLLRKLLARTICELKDKTLSLTLGKVTPTIGPKEVNHKDLSVQGPVFYCGYGLKCSWKLDCKNLKLVARHFKLCICMTVHSTLIEVAKSLNSLSTSLLTSFGNLKFQE